MNRSQDTVIDDDEETWYVQTSQISSWRKANQLRSPLCIEEFDLSDKNFRPCPCGYQVRYLSLPHGAPTDPA